MTLERSQHRDLTTASQAGALGGGGGSGRPAVGIVCFIVHHQPVIHEVEAVRLCLIRVTNHLADCKRGPARTKVRNLSHATKDFRTGIGGGRDRGTTSEILSFSEPASLLVAWGWYRVEK